MMKNFAGLIFILAVFLPTSHGVRCYSCNSVSNPSCLNVARGENGTNKLECSSPGGPGSDVGLGCFVAEGEGNVKGEVGVTRGCTVGGEAHCATLSALALQIGGQVTSCETCHTDLCNSAGGLATSLAVLLGLLYCHLVS